MCVCEAQEQQAKEELCEIQGTKSPAHHHFLPHITSPGPSPPLGDPGPQPTPGSKPPSIPNTSGRHQHDAASKVERAPYYHTWSASPWEVKKDGCPPELCGAPAGRFQASSVFKGERSGLGMTRSKGSGQTG
ncbi:hypothetical protein ILYODFUR_009635 [Ilyodon furcidens]|uniref:Uncharacterized protein n=1 Tax=Ilyodon furcidens TaxID=33524 RepID=A0ABV0U402_9TELE